MMDDKSEEWKAELEAKCHDPSLEIVVPMKATGGDVSHLLPYFADPLHGFMPHMAMSIRQIQTRLPEDLAFPEHITYPIHITLAEQDTAIDNDEARKVFAQVKTPEHLKELRSYESGHIILSDGWLINDIVGSQITWLDKVF